MAAQPAQRSVLVLDQSSAGLPFNAAVTSAIRSTINAGSRSPTSFYSEHLDANRFFGPEYENEFVQFLKAKYRERHIDVVIVFGVSALDFIERRRERLLLPERPRKRVMEKMQANPWRNWSPLPSGSALCRATDIQHSLSLNISNASMVQRDNRKFVWEAYELEARDFEWNRSSSC